jgi:5-methylcytosine-specific restriction protein A
MGERISGRKLNRAWSVGAAHALYHAKGQWYHCLTQFPGALFDPDGYVVFVSEADFRGCSHLQIGEHVHVPGSLKQIPSYTLAE